MYKRQIDDNPFLAKSFVENLKKEYYGTILYDRYILGRWTLAEGLIYKIFADNPQKFYISKDKLPKRFETINIGHDFGGNKSAHTFVCLLYTSYPVHQIDKIGVLSDIQPDSEQPPWKKNLGRKKTKDELKKERQVSLDTAFEACGINGDVTVKDLSEYMGVSEKTVRNRLKEHGGYWIDEGNVGKK